MQVVPLTRPLTATEGIVGVPLKPNPDMGSPVASFLGSASRPPSGSEFGCDPADVRELGVHRHSFGHRNGRVERAGKHEITRLQ
jgi:hypothetical protein